jgi:hypothetical protein
MGPNGESLSTFSNMKMKTDAFSGNFSLIDECGIYGCYVACCKNQRFGGTYPLHPLHHQGDMNRCTANNVSRN